MFFSTVLRSVSEPARFVLRSESRGCMFLRVSYTGAPKRIASLSPPLQRLSLWHLSVEDHDSGIMGSVDRDIPGPFDVKSVAIIGAGPSGLAAAKYLLAQPGPPQAAGPSASRFSNVTIYEQQAQVGGVWLYSSNPVSETPIPQTSALAPPDPPVDPGDGGPERKRPVFPSPMYEKLNTNIPHTLMQYSDFPFTDDQGRTVEQDGDLRIFPEREVVQRYLEEYSKEVRHLIRFSTSVLSVKLHKVVGNDGTEKDQWDVTSRDLLTRRETTETYDAVVVASGHYSTTYVPDVEGIRDFDQRHPGVISHSKTYRTPDKFRGKKVLLVGNSASGLDIASQITQVCQKPLLVSVRTNTPEDVREHVGFEEVAEIARFLPDKKGVQLKDGRGITDLDAVLFCTGYLFTFPYFEEGELQKGEPLVTNGRRVYALYKHFLHIHHPTLAFPGLPMKVIPFPVSESQAAVIARVWANELALPSVEEMEAWERQEEEERGPGKYHVFPPLGDGKYINGAYDWVTKRPGRGKMPPRWDEEMFWERGLYAQAKIKFETGGKKARTLKELGYIYKPEEKETKAQEASIKEPGLDVAG